jgi:hypothetical protein
MYNSMKEGMTMPGRGPTEDHTVMRERLVLVGVILAIVVIANAVLLYLHVNHGLSPMFSAIANGLILAFAIIMFLFKLWSNRRETEGMEDEGTGDDD